MFQMHSTKFSTTENLELSEVVNLVREGLSNRRKVPTPAEERRLSKTLQRLRPAANVALAGVAESRARLEFSAILCGLSDA